MQRILISGSSWMQHTYLAVAAAVVALAASPSVRERLRVRSGDRQDAGGSRALHDRQVEA